LVSCSASGSVNRSTELSISCGRTRHLQPVSGRSQSVWKQCLGAAA
jgi:hypothetical protein